MRMKDEINPLVRGIEGVRLLKNTLPHPSERRRTLTNDLDPAPLKESNPLKPTRPILRYHGDLNGDFHVYEFQTHHGEFCDSRKDGCS